MCGGYISLIFCLTFVFAHAHSNVCCVMTQEGEVLKQAMQPFESHVPYLLQFFLDYEVYGMGWLHLRGENVMVSVGDRSSCLWIDVWVIPVIL